MGSICTGLCTDGQHTFAHGRLKSVSRQCLYAADLHASLCLSIAEAPANEEVGNDATAYRSWHGALWTATVSQHC